MIRSFAANLPAATGSTWSMSKNNASTDLSLVCPDCRGPLADVSDDRIRCSKDGAELVRQGGIWSHRVDEPVADLETLREDYRRLRQDEGWGTPDGAYYRALPFHDITGRHTEIWRIRAASYDLLIRKVLTGQRRVVDLGAGNCWLSWRLATQGHTAAAIDLSNDALDGLAAAEVYPEIQFLRLQTTFDQVPFSDGAFDLAIFNGSLHYASNLTRTLTEARRLVRTGGQVVIMDTPVYRFARSGQQMLQERSQDWQRRYGPAFGASQTAGFLTRGDLRRLGKSLGIRWQVHALPLGWRWRLAPLAALARGRREPARFPLIVGRPIKE